MKCITTYLTILIVVFYCYQSLSEIEYIQLIKIKENITSNNIIKVKDDLISETLENKTWASAVLYKWVYTKNTRTEVLEIVKSNKDLELKIKSLLEEQLTTNKPELKEIRRNLIMPYMVLFSGSTESDKLILEIFQNNKNDNIQPDILALSLGMNLSKKIQKDLVNESLMQGKLILKEILVRNESKTKEHLPIEEIERIKSEVENEILKSEENRKRIKGN